jgi:MFS family permease
MHLMRRILAVVSPPVPINTQQRRLLGALSCIAVMTGYQGSIVTQTISFAVDEFGTSKAAQGRALAFIRLDIVLTLVAVRLADRFGRRRLLLWCAVLGPVLTAFSSVAPSLAGLAGFQVVSRSVVTATAILTAVIGVEQMPAAARAWASSVLVAIAACGSGALFLPLALADSNERFWRLLFLPPLVALVVVPVCARWITESSRFEQLEQRRKEGKRDARFGQFRHRLVLIGVWLVLMGIFSTPSRQFLNDFLREERNFSSSGLSQFAIVTNIPGTAGIILGGALSDLIGRRRTVAWGLIGFGVATGLQYATGGPTMWVCAAFGSLFGAAALPGLAILVPEIFPTALRSRVSGISTGFNRIGSGIGLVIVGATADRFSIGSTLALLATSVVLGSLVLFRLPEAAREELEALNPEDDQPRLTIHSAAM